MRMADTALRLSGGAPDDAGVKKLVEYWKGVQFRREDETWTQLSVSSAEEWAQIDKAQAATRRGTRTCRRFVSRVFADARDTARTPDLRIAPEISRQEALLDSLSAILPRRIVNEDQGDYIERIRECIGGQPGRAWALCVENRLLV